MFPYGDNIAEVIGTFDFALGVLAFIIERFDDIRKTELHNAVEDINDTVRSGEAVTPEKVEKFVRIVKGNQKIGGFLNCGNKVINNFGEGESGNEE